MSINVSDTYSKYISSIVSKISQTAKNEQNNNTNNTTSTTSDSSSVKLDLESSLSELSSYLNYDSDGSYSSNLSLADVLNSDTQDEDNSLFDPFESDSSSSSISSAFDSLAQAKTTEINNVISNALKKLTGSENESA